MRFNYNLLLARARCSKRKPAVYSRDAGEDLHALLPRPFVLHKTFSYQISAGGTPPFFDLLQIDLFSSCIYEKVDSYGRERMLGHVMVTFLLFSLLFLWGSTTMTMKLLQSSHEPISCVHTPSINIFIRILFFFSLSLSLFPVRNKATTRQCESCVIFDSPRLRMEMCARCSSQRGRWSRKRQNM